MPAARYLIASSTVGAGGAASIDFTSIPSTYTDLSVKLSIRNNAGGGQAVRMEFNGSDSASGNYTIRLLEGDGASATSGNATTTAIVGTASGTTHTANSFTSIDVYVPNYASSNYKSHSSDSAQETNATTAYLDLVATTWAVTSAISSIKIYTSSGNLVQYSSAYLYGIKNS
jgi:hypothetical protein